MHTKYIVVNGLKLAFLEANEDKPFTIFFIHGNSGSSATWHLQLDSSLLSEYRLIAIDLPGHGNSQEPTEPNLAYSPIELGSFLAEAVSILVDKRPFIVAGFSFGTNLVGEMMLHQPNSKGIILISSCVVSSIQDLQQVFLPNPLGTMLFNDSYTEAELDNFANECFLKKDQNELNQFRYDFSKTKFPFRSTLGKKAAEGAVNNEIELLNKAGYPVLFIFGKEDKILNVDYLDAIELNKWQSCIHKIAVSGHFVHVDQSDRCNLLIHNYASEMFKEDHI